jgi:hypothetical protein
MEKGHVFLRRWRDDNTMTKRKGRKDQTMIYKTLHRKQQIGQHEPYPGKQLHNICVIDDNTYLPFVEITI